VQPDRLVLNWRKTPEEPTYPRYETLRPIFVREVEEYFTFLETIGISRPVISQAEVTYVNPIPISALDESADLKGVLAPWSGENSDDFLPVPEDSRILLRYLIPNPETGDAVGRLYVEGAGATHQELGRVYMLQLFARGKPLSEGVHGALAFLDLGHDWVVRGFASLTTTSLHDNWIRQE
jgi:uncharacterized protein (TIGR04255 family)